MSIAAIPKQGPSHYYQSQATITTVADTTITTVADTTIKPQSPVSSQKKKKNNKATVAVAANTKRKFKTRS
jgi:hypothetical protein